MSFAKRRAADQMDRDGIRTLSAGEGYGTARCAHKGEPYMALVTGCKNPARYHVKGVGIRCFSHAIEFAGRADA